MKGTYELSTCRRRHRTSRAHTIAKTESPFHAASSRDANPTCTFIKRRSRPTQSPQTQIDPQNPLWSPRPSSRAASPHTSPLDRNPPHLDLAPRHRRLGTPSLRPQPPGPLRLRRPRPDRPQHRPRRLAHRLHPLPRRTPSPSPPSSAPPPAPVPPTGPSTGSPSPSTATSGSSTPSGFHLTSLLLHALNGALLFFTSSAVCAYPPSSPLPQLLCSGSASPSTPSPSPGSAPAPIPLCLFFLLLSLIATLRFLDHRGAPRPRWQWPSSPPQPLCSRTNPASSSSPSPLLAILFCAEAQSPPPSDRRPALTLLGSDLTAIAVLLWIAIRVAVRAHSATWALGPTGLRLHPLEVHRLDTAAPSA